MIFEDMYRGEYEAPISAIDAWRPSVYGVLFNEDRTKILVQKQGDVPFWELPGGGVGMHESLIDGMKREFLEETDLHVEVVNSVPFGVHERWMTDLERTRFRHALIFCYEVTSLGKADDADLYIGPEEITKQTYISLAELTEENVQKWHWPAIKLLKDR